MLDVADITIGISKDSNGVWRPPEPSLKNFSEKIHQTVCDAELSSFWFQHRLACAEQVINRFSPGATLVDVGGGNGLISHTLQSRGISTILVDPDYSATMNAKVRGVKEVICATFGDCCFKPESLPAIGLFDVLEHIYNDKDFLLEIKKSLKNRGRLYMTVPAYDFLWSAKDELAGHHRRYRLAQLKKLLGSSGYEIIHSTYMFSPLVLPIFFSLALPTRLNLCNYTVGTHREKHIKHKMFSLKVLNWILRHEAMLIGRKISVPFGSSCLIVAESL